MPAVASEENQHAGGNAVEDALHSAIVIVLPVAVIVV